MAVRLSRRGLESCFSRRVPPPSSRPAGKAGGPGDVTAAAAAVSQICMTEFSTRLSDVKKREEKKLRLTLKIVSLAAAVGLVTSRKTGSGVLGDLRRGQTGCTGTGWGYSGPAGVARTCEREAERGREREKVAGGGGTHSGRIHWESAESMFYRAIIRLVFGEGVKQTGPVRS